MPRRDRIIKLPALPEAIGGRRIKGKKLEQYIERLDFDAIGEPTPQHERALAVRRNRASAANITSQIRSRIAAQLFLGGASVAIVAKELGITEEAALDYRDRVYQALQKSLPRDVEDIRGLEAARLEKLLHSFWDRATGGHIASAELVLKILEKFELVMGLTKTPSTSTTQINIANANITPEAAQEIRTRLLALADLSQPIEGEIVEEAGDD